jgi:hypothetical protein
MRKILLSLLLALGLTYEASPQTYNQVQWGMNLATNPYQVGVTVNGIFAQLGTVSPTGVWTVTATGSFGTAAYQNIGTSGANVPLLSTANTWSGAQTINNLVSTEFPGLSAGVQGGTIAGLDGGQWFIYNAPASFNSFPSLRVDRHVNSGTGINGNTYQSIWSYCTTNTFNLGFEWCGLFQAENNAYSSTTTESQNVALNGTMTKKQPTAYATTGASGTGTTATLTFATQPTAFPVGSWIVVYGVTPTGYNGNYVVTASTTTSVSYASTTTGAQTVAGTVRNAVGPSWGGNFVCGEQTNETDPHSSCIGAEMDVHIANANGVATTDANKQRVGVQISLGSDISNTHIGRGLLINMDGNTIVDNAIEINNRSGHVVYQVTGGGQEVIASDTGGWSSFNFGKELIVGPENNGVTNPSIGMSDANATNLWAITNYGSNGLIISAMPALSDSSTAPIQAVQVNRNGIVNFPYGIRSSSGTLINTAAPTIGSGFGTGASIVANNGASAFQVNVGTGGTANSGVVTMPVATNGWSCSVSDVTTASTSVFLTKQIASTTTSVTVTNYNTAGTATAWTASDKLNFLCLAF